ncbi:MAG: hypothetical protein E6Q98_25805 [Rhodospirillaceae bacterium]|jgi:hypothetical protein|nr:MAG: hypothetical protein E6Q98_25805 [Rhodospirillaceae bacterium]
MLEAVIRFLITMCLIALCVFLVIWVLGAIGIVLPAMVVKIIWIIAALVAVLFLVRLLKPYWGNYFP